MIGVYCHARLLRRQWLRRTRFTEFSRGMWARSSHLNQSMPFWGADGPRAQLETFPVWSSVSGIPQGQPSYQRALHKTRDIIYSVQVSSNINNGDIMQV